MPFRPSSHRLPWSLGLLSLMAIFVMARWHVVDLDRYVRREGLSSQIYVASRSALIDLLDVETGVRGYLIATGDEFLRPYHEGLGRLTDDILRLRSRVGLDPLEAPHVGEAERLTARLLREFAAQVAMSRAEGIEAARRRFLANPTKPTMDDIRMHLAAVQAEEQSRLDHSRETLDRHLATTIWLLNSATIVTGIVLVSLASGFLRPPVPAPPRLE